ncbi:hypothetical protein ACHAWF_016514 [Thalassiosira exigua]
MSEFASLLASFKQNASAASSAPSQSSSPSPSDARSTRRKRPRPDASAHSQSTFPSMHLDARKGKKDGFELSFLAGTSWLHTLLKETRFISLPNEQKEVHFWDWHYRKGFDWYIRQFDFSPRSTLVSNHPLYCGEITPDYVVLSPPTIAEISKCFPDLKVVFVARDLAERAWSAMTMELRDQTMGRNPGEFAKGVIAGDKQSWKKAKGNETKVSVAQQRRLQQQSSASSQPDSYYIDRLRSETHTSRSDYATHLKHWYSHFPSENILIIDFREIESKPRGVLVKIMVHIGVGEDDAKVYVEKLRDKDVEQRVNASMGTASRDKDVRVTTVEKSAQSTFHHATSQRPRLVKEMYRYLGPYALKFNMLLEEKGYSWRLNEYTA